MRKAVTTHWRRGRAVINVKIDIYSSDEGTARQITIELVAEQVNFQLCVDELRALAVNWARTWMGRDDVSVKLANRSVTIHG
jgi:hypothetical protein